MVVGLRYKIERAWAYTMPFFYFYLSVIYIPSHLQLQPLYLLGRLMARSVHSRPLPLTDYHSTSFSSSHASGNAFNALRNAMQWARGCNSSIRITGQ